MTKKKAKIQPKDVRCDEIPYDADLDDAIEVAIAARHEQLATEKQETIKEEDVM